MLGVDENDELIDTLQEATADYAAKQTFPQMILENLKTAGVQQAHKEDRITFTALTPWPGDLVCAEGRYLEGETEKRAAIFIGPEFGTVQRADLVAAAREAGDAGFDVLIACAFNYEAHATEFSKLGRIPVLKARMNADLHMADDLKNTGKGNLFVIFGEPDIDILTDERTARCASRSTASTCSSPRPAKSVSDGADGIACWFIDTDYNEESFFVRHAYFLGANDPYSALKTTLKAEIDEEAWATLQQRHLAPVRQAEVRPDRGQGHQPPRGRGDEGVQGVRDGASYRKPALESLQPQAPGNVMDLVAAAGVDVQPVARAEGRLAGQNAARESEVLLRVGVSAATMSRRCSASGTNPLRIADGLIVYEDSLRDSATAPRSDRCGR